MSSLTVNILGALITVWLFFVNPAAGLISALVFGIVAIRLANAERRRR
jgi:hypothetical protein